jgi:formylmethanofuran dehydrogenase subunit C
MAMGAEGGMLSRRIAASGSVESIVGCSMAKALVELVGDVGEFSKIDGLESSRSTDKHDEMRSMLPSR